MTKKLHLIALLFASLIGAAPVSHAHSPQGRHLTGTIQQADATTCHAVLLTNDKSSVSFAWNKNTDFVAGSEFVPASRLSRGVPVEIILHQPFFGEPFVTKVVFLNRTTKQ